MASVTETAVIRELTIDARPETVWEFLVDSEKATRWMGIDATLEPHPGGFWLFEVPTPNGVIDFDAASGASMAELATESSAACLTIADASLETTEVPIEQRLVEVLAHSVTPAVHEQ